MGLNSAVPSQTSADPAQRSHGLSAKKPRHDIQHYGENNRQNETGNDRRVYRNVAATPAKIARQLAQAQARTEMEGHACQEEQSAQEHQDFGKGHDWLDETEAAFRASRHSEASIRLR